MRSNNLIGFGPPRTSVPTMINKYVRFSVEKLFEISADVCFKFAEILNVVHHK